MANKLRLDISQKYGKSGNNVKHTSYTLPKSMFWGCRLMHKYLHFNEPDVRHWREKGWLDRKRPWR